MLSLFILSSELLNSRSLLRLHIFSRVGFRNRSKDQFECLRFVSDAFGLTKTYAFSSSYHNLKLNLRIAHVRFVNHAIPLNPSKNLIELNLPVLRFSCLTSIPP